MKYKVNALRSDDIYREIAAADPDQKTDIYRYKLMAPFKPKWDCYQIPMKAREPGGYDIIMASDMLGYLNPRQIDEKYQATIEMLSADCFWEECRQSVENALRCFTDRGIELPVKNYLFTATLAQPDSPYATLIGSYCGDGGIPGYLFATLIPSPETLARQPVVLAHETNHNVRFQFEPWHNDITLGEMLVHEGLAENFAAHLYGEARIGPWIQETDMETLNDYIKPIMKDGLNAQGLDNITAYLYGDEMARQQNYFPVGLPYCAGYACGYYLIKHYLEKTGRSIIEATLLPSAEILAETNDFW